MNRVEGVGLTPGGVVGHRADGQRANAVPQGVFLAVHLGIQAGVARTAGVGCADGGIEVSEVVSGDVVCTGGNGARLIRKVEAGRMPTRTRNSSPMALARASEIPETSARRMGSRSIICRVLSPNLATMRAADTGPMPLMTRPAR